MKVLKITALVLAAGFLALFGYANLRVLSIAEKLKPVELTSFRLYGEMNEQTLADLEKKIENTEGVTACTINGKSETACIIYYQDIVSESMLTSLLTNKSTMRVEKKDLAASGGGCPVHQAGASISQLIAVLDLRSH
jgi:hypothetical protein